MKDYIFSLLGCGEGQTQFCAWVDWLGARISLHLLSDKALRDYGLFGGILIITILLEIAGRKNWRVRYGSRNFRIDMLYYVFYYSGLYHILFFSYIFLALNNFVTAYVPGLRTEFLASLSVPVQVLVLVILNDFTFYWGHRMVHANRYLWAFHSIHHSQTTLNAMTGFRYHIVDETVRRIVTIIPFQIIGYTHFVYVWLWADFIIAWVFLVQHSEWNWSYGKLGRIFVSPKFHRIHHSTDIAVANHNYSAIFSFWDDLFGTAERERPSPTVYGLAGNPVRETLLAQFVYPFVTIARDLRRPAPSATAIAPPPNTVAE
jgi:sterol desaturase/sphingolipid hydroxylase (fatty acid hydroxylase superfamily)